MLAPQNQQFTVLDSIESTQTAWYDEIDMAIANSDDNILSLQLKNYANLNTWEKRIEDIIDRVNLIKGENK